MLSTHLISELNNLHKVHKSDIIFFPLFSISMSFPCFYLEQKLVEGSLVIRVFLFGKFWINLFTIIFNKPNTFFLYYFFPSFCLFIHFFCLAGCYAYMLRPQIINEGACMRRAKSYICVR